MDDPPAETIAARCLEIRDSWDDRTRISRRVGGMPGRSERRYRVAFRECGRRGEFDGGPSWESAVRMIEDEGEFES